MTLTLVTPELKTRIIDLAKGGMAAAEIWVAINRLVQPAYIAVIISKARKAGESIPYHKPGPRTFNDGDPTVFTCRVSGDAAVVIREAAARRNVDPRSLVTDILETVASDGIINAVLDDL